MKELKVLIVPWGDPIGWQKIKYNFGSDEREGWDTVPIIVDNLDIENVVFVVSDTLVNSVIGIAKEDSWLTNKLKEKFDSQTVNNIVKRSVDHFKELYQKINEQYEPLEIYNTLINSIRDYANTFIDKYILSETNRGIKHKVFVEFGTGRFKYLESVGSPVDFYYSFLSDFANYLIAKNVFDYQRLNIYVDTTHGINYFTIMIYKAVRVIASLLANLIEVRIITYNTDPFVPGTDITKPLFINETENILAEPYTSIYVKKSKKSLSSEEKKLIYFLASAKFMLMLPVLYFVPTEPLDSKITNMIKDYINKMDFDFSDVNMKLSLNKNSHNIRIVELYVKAYLWQQILKTIFKGYTLNSLHRKATEEGLSLNDFERIVNSVKNTAIHIAKEEIDHIRYVVFKQGEYYPGIRQSGDINWVKRNLIAHAGFVLKNPVKPQHNDDPVFKISDINFFLDTLRYSLLELAKTQ